MSKKIIGIAVFLSLCILGIILLSDTLTTFHLLAIGALSIVNLLLILGVIYKRYRTEWKPVAQHISYSDENKHDLSALKSISSETFLFGLEKKLLNKEKLYFDQKHLFVISPQLEVAIFNLSDVIGLTKTGVKINNRSIWQLTVKTDQKEPLEFKFLNNYTFSNNNFKIFYELLQQNHPSAQLSKWKIWTL